MPLVILAIMILLLLLSWNNISDYKNETQIEYNKYMSAAEEFEGKGIYIDAVKYYENALKLKPDDYETAMKIVSMYEFLKNDSSYLNALEKAINSDSSNPEPYLLYSRRCLEIKNNKGAYSMLRRAESTLGSLKNPPQDALNEISDMLQSLTGKYELFFFNADEYFGLHYLNGYGEGQAVVRCGDKYGIMDGDGVMKRPADYDDINLIASDLIPLKIDGEYYYTDNFKHKKLVTDEPASYLGPFTGKYAPVKIGDNYGYMGMKMEHLHFEYEYAGPFENNVAAVKKDGKWGLINTSFSSPTGFVYDEILIDHYGFCATYGVFFAKKDGGKYSLYNLSGQELASGFDEVKQFESIQPAAVCISGKWGYISIDGHMVIEPQYEDAQSFSIGFGPVKKDGKWGCIDLNNKILLTPQFEYMGPMSRAGRCYVEADGEPHFMRVDAYNLGVE